MPTVNAITRSRQYLNTGWKFRQADKNDWYAATVPGCVHTDLLKNKLIDNPFYRDNEQKLQWIGKVDWEYESVFQVKPETLKAKHVELVFAGLDTYAQVFLNDSPLLSANNMFREWRVDAKALLKPGANTLRIHFRSPINEILPVMAKLDYQLPSPNDQGEKTSPYTRKAPYQFGWDWGPRFVTSGIWQPVMLESWDEARIDSIRVVTKELKTEAAQLSAEVEIDATNNLEATVVLENETSRGVVARQAVSLKPGLNRVAVDFVIKNPAVWWPNGMGEHPLYNFQTRLLNQQEVIDKAATQVGIRTLELRQQPDQWGKSFMFVINGVPVFAKGGNWIPADSFPTRITKERYRQLVTSVRDTNMNMLRVWGGGIYESDDFYNLCDEMGILVWQDFMFACSMYPGDKEFLDNVRQEAIDNVKRLRNHPSLVIWVGNNEVETAWMHWGWKQNLPPKLWDYYKAIFHDVLPKVCAELDPSRPYWPSSPSSNLEDDSDSQKIGDVHYWGVWHAALPFTDYEKQLPRFMSEYGFQSFPELKTVASYALPQDRMIESPVMMAHQKHPRGNQLIREYMLRDYPQPKDFESFLYVSQLLQAEGIKVGAEHLRRIMPRNMGSLYWQIDDCWPVASWSSIDYFGRWKALQYYARRFYSDLLVSPHEENGELKIYVVSDKQKPFAGKLKLTLMDLNGNALWQTNKEVTIEARHSAVYDSESRATLLGNRDPRQTFLNCELLVNDKIVSSSHYFFAPAKDLALIKPKITTTVSQSAQGFLVSLTTDKFARAVYLSVDESNGSFSDNYFDLVPGQAVQVELKARQPMKKSEVEAQLKVRSLVDAF
ncbi:MAG TPA: glycoside hydrolase family 2 protein [Pyrinomonadaceae bacterium]|nr:glycoside hydrolase family 2 protein [Pyrinomonadaceae bacterium]